MQWCACKYLTIGLWRWRLGGFWFLAFASFHTINIPIMADFKVPRLISTLFTKLKRHMHIDSHKTTSCIPTSPWLLMISTWKSYCHLKFSISKDKNHSTNPFQITFTLLVVCVRRELGSSSFWCTWGSYHYDNMPSSLGPPCYQGMINHINKADNKNCSTQFFLCRDWQIPACEPNSAHHLFW
jgi:hypothetical protein